MEESKKALLILAEGAEEIEAVIAIDCLRRAKIEVVVAGLKNDCITLCSRGVNIKPDKSLADVQDDSYDVVILPGGGQGAKNLAGSSAVGTVLSKHYKKDKLIAAICAAPTALAAHGIGKGEGKKKQVTCYPSMKEKMQDDYIYSENNVVKDGNIITSRGPGTAFEWAIEIVRILVGDKMANTLNVNMLLH